MKVKRDDLEKLINGLTYVYHEIKNNPDLESRINGFTISHIIEARDFLEDMWREFQQKSTAVGPRIEVEALSFGDPYGTTEYSFKTEEP